MAFHLIDMETWERRDHYRYYQTLVRTGYTLTGYYDASVANGGRIRVITAAEN